MRVAWVFPLIMASVCLLSPSVAVGQITAQEDEEFEIIGAVLSDPATTHGWRDWPRNLSANAERIEVNPKTALDVADASLRGKGTTVSVSAMDGTAVISFDRQLLTNEIDRNRTQLPLNRLRLPQPMVWAAANEGAVHGPVVRFTVSRPGISADRVHAVIAVTVDTDVGPSRPGQPVYLRSAHGYTVYLEKSEGTWKVVGRTVPWVT